MQVFSVRKDGFDPNEFSDVVLCLQPDGLTWKPATPADVPTLPAFFFHGYNCGHHDLKDDALDSIRSIDSIWRQLNIRFEPVTCLWPGLGENKLEALEFNRAIRNARKSAGMFAAFINQFRAWQLQAFGLRNVHPAIASGHSLGCAVTGWLLAGLDQPLDLVVWMGAAVPRYATSTLDPVHATDLVQKITCGMFEFSPAIASKTTRLVNVFGDDPVLKSAFEISVHQKACGRYGAYTGPERLPNVTDIDVSSAVHQHGDYRHYLPMWQQLREIVRMI